VIVGVGGGAGHGLEAERERERDETTVRTCFHDEPRALQCACQRREGFLALASRRIGRGVIGAITPR
jgi:hypothetical protein